MSWQEKIDESIAQAVSALGGALLGAAAAHLGDDGLDLWLFGVGFIVCGFFVVPWFFSISRDRARRLASPPAGPVQPSGPV